MGSQPDLSRVPEGSPGLPTPSLLPRSRALYLAGPTRRATFGPKILRRKRQSRGRVASHALLSPSRMVGPPPLARSRCPFIPAEPRSARPPLAGLASSGPGQQAGRRELPRFVYSLSGDNKDCDPDSPLHQHLPCLLFSLPLTKFTQEGNSFLPSLYGGRR